MDLCSFEILHDFTFLSRKMTARPQILASGKCGMTSQFGCPLPPWPLHWPSCLWTSSAPRSGVLRTLPGSLGVTLEMGRPLPSL